MKGEDDTENLNRLTLELLSRTASDRAHRPICSRIGREFTQRVVANLSKRASISWGFIRGDDCANARPSNFETNFSTDPLLIWPRFPSNGLVEKQCPNPVNKRERTVLTN